jgi:hypothetical protein
MKRALLWAIALAYVPAAFADNAPVCLNKQGNAIVAPNNDQVIAWKTSTPSSYLDRGFIRGTIVTVIPSNPSHLHLEVSLSQKNGAGKANNIEIIYNMEFGQTPNDLRPGMEVIACGDYITSNQQNGPYPPSPDNAILHWVHKAMNDRHESGFLMIDGRLYGQEDAPPRRNFHSYGGGGADLELNIQGCHLDQGNCGTH